MITDSELRVKGFKALAQALGTVNAEKFMALILREPFDYTKWRRQLWAGKTVEEISRAAMELRRRAQKRKEKTTGRTSASTGRGRRGR